MNEFDEQVPVSEPTAEQQMARMSRRSFLWAGVSIGVGYGILRWINTSDQVYGIAKPLRRALELNEGVMSSLYSPARLSPEFDRSLAVDIRVNGMLGLEATMDPAQWVLKGPGGETGLDKILAMPKTEMVTEHKCVEGWSSIVHWGGTRFSEFTKLYPPPAGTKFVGLATPDGKYTVSVDLAAMMHPQTLLCYEMNGKPLTDEHGAPLRLVIPHKYGVKSLKRIGWIRYGAEKMPDYWGREGYDWDLAL